MRVTFDEVSVTGFRTWRDEHSKRRQETRTFRQTINPFNQNLDGSVKTRAQITSELVAARDAWLRTLRGELESKS